MADHVRQRVQPESYGDQRSVSTYTMDGLKSIPGGGAVRRFRFEYQMFFGDVKTVKPNRPRLSPKKAPKVPWLTA